MTEMLAEMIASILGLIKKGEIRQASERLDRIYYDMLRQDAAYFRAIPEDRLTLTLFIFSNSPKRSRRPTPLKGHAR